MSSSPGSMLTGFLFLPSSLLPPPSYSFPNNRFCVESSLSLKEFTPDSKLVLSSKNIMDRWIMASLQTLVQFVRKEMEGYRLYTVIPQLVNFVEQLTNWFAFLFSFPCTPFTSLSFSFCFVFLPLFLKI